jgi:RNA polymerase sigma-70 factor (ECF subfamily)
MTAMPRQNLLFFRKKNKTEIPDDSKLVRDCLEGDRQAFEKIVEKYREQVFWTAYHLVLDHEDARDVSQQTFIKVWKSLPVYNAEKSFAGWISKIAANCAIDFLRSRKETEVLEDVAVERTSIDRDLDVQKIFLRVAPLLSPRQRIVLVMREIQGMEISEIAGILQCTESTVRNLLSQAKGSFRNKVKELFPEYAMQSDPDR